MLLPVADDEAFWIGVNADREVELAVNVERQGEEAIDALSGRRWNTRPPQTISLVFFAIIAGIRRDDGTLWCAQRKRGSNLQRDRILHAQPAPAEAVPCAARHLCKFCQAHRTKTARRDQPKRGLQGVPSALVGLTSACSVRRLSY